MNDMGFWWGVLAAILGAVTLEDIRQQDKIRPTKFLYAAYGWWGFLRYFNELWSGSGEQQMAALAFVFCGSSPALGYFFFAREGQIRQRFFSCFWFCCLWGVVWYGMTVLSTFGNYLVWLVCSFALTLGWWHRKSFFSAFSRHRQKRRETAQATSREQALQAEEHRKFAEKMGALDFLIEQQLYGEALEMITTLEVSFPQHLFALQAQRKRTLDLETQAKFAPEQRKPSTQKPPTKPEGSEVAPIVPSLSPLPNPALLINALQLIAGTKNEEPVHEPPAPDPADIKQLGRETKPVANSAPGQSRAIGPGRKFLPTRITKNRD